MWQNFIPEKYHEMVIAQFPAFQTVTGEICPPPEEGWEIFPTEYSFYGSGPNQKVYITSYALHILGDILDYGDYRVTSIILYTDNRLMIHYRDDLEQRTDGCYCVLPINGKTYFRQYEAIQPDIIRNLFGHLPDELTAWHIEKLREHFGDEDPEKTIKPHWRLKNFVGDEYEKIEPFLSVWGDHEFDEWEVIVRRKSITVENTNDDRKYCGGTSHTFMTYTDDEARTEIYHDAFVTLEVLTEEEDNCCIPVEITVNESGIVVDVTYGKDEYLGMDEVEEKCGGLPWFDDEASVMYTLLS